MNKCVNKTLKNFMEKCDNIIKSKLFIIIIILSNNC